MGFPFSDIVIKERYKNMIELSKIKMPELKVLNKGERYKIFEVRGSEGAMMPLHLSTKEAVLIVQEGEAVLIINNENNKLNRNDFYTIPAATAHSLLIKSKFKAFVIMELDSEIEFIN